MTDTLTMAAPAKLNLGLAVTARRGDGYHELHTIFARLSLADTLTVRPADRNSLELSTDGELPGAAQLSAEDNLVLRAAEAFAVRFGTGGARFTLHKRIPVAAGLGGGSSDAAAALLLLDRLHPGAAGQADLQELALQLGSDVPFFLAQTAAALARGRGERLKPLSLPVRHVVLVHPGGSVASADAYAWLQNFSRRLKTDDIRTALGEGREPRLQNALQSGVALHRPAVRDAVMALRNLGLQGVLMSGSGPVCFGLAADAAAAEAAAQELAAEQPGWWVRTGTVAG